MDKEKAIMIMSKLPRSVLVRYVQSIDATISGVSKKAMAEQFYSKYGLSEENASSLLEIHHAISQEREPFSVYQLWLANTNIENLKNKIKMEINDNKAEIGDDKYVLKEGYQDLEETETELTFIFSFVRTKTKFDIIKLDFDSKKENISIPITIKFIEGIRKAKVFVYCRRPDLQRFIKFNKETQGAQ